MSLKLNVGLSKKLGLPNYGSLGASCHLELELDQSLLVADLEGLQRRIRQAYAVCGQAVTEELSRGQPMTQEVRAPVNGSAYQKEPAHRNGSPAAHNGTSVENHRATEKQLTYLRQLAGQIQGLGIRRLDKFAEQICGRPLADLSGLDASRLIDLLKAVKDGTLDLQAAVENAAENAS